MKPTTEQNIINQVDDDYQMAYRYFSILSILNNLELVNRDIQLLSYACAENKTITDVKKEFCEKFNTSKHTVGNIISKLYKTGIIIKNKRIVSVIPLLKLEFDKNISLNIVFEHGSEQEAE